MGVRIPTWAIVGAFVVAAAVAKTAWDFHQADQIDNVTGPQITWWGDFERLQDVGGVVYVNYQLDLRHDAHAPLDRVTARVFGIVDATRPSFELFDGERDEPATQTRTEVDWRAVRDRYLGQPPYLEVEIREWEPGVRIRLRFAGNTNDLNIAAQWRRTHVEVSAPIPALRHDPRTWWRKLLDDHLDLGVN